jgi:hypothetical protein
MSQKFCASCAFWEGQKDKPENSGKCHRFLATGIVPMQNPITQQVIPVMLGDYASSQANGWCGEYKTNLLRN